MPTPEDEEEFKIFVNQSTEGFEQLADGAETLARSIRAAVVLMQARADPGLISRHLGTAIVALEAIKAGVVWLGRVKGMRP